jgi:hypothetical protein
MTFHAMEHLQLVDGGYYLQIWRAVTNISNKQSQTAEKRWSSRIGTV